MFRSLNLGDHSEIKIILLRHIDDVMIAESDPDIIDLESILDGFKTNLPRQLVQYSGCFCQGLEEGSIVDPPGGLHPKCIGRS